MGNRKGNKERSANISYNDKLILVERQPVRSFRIMVLFNPPVQINMMEIRRGNTSEKVNTTIHTCSRPVQEYVSILM